MWIGLSSGVLTYLAHMLRHAPIFFVILLLDDIAAPLSRKLVGYLTTLHMD
jgi:hypothetical protein